MTDHDLLLQVSDKVDEIKSYFLNETLTVQNIADILGVHTRTLGRKPWLVPRFGLSQYDGVKRWDRREWLHWNQRPVKERRDEYYQEVKENEERTGGQRSGVAEVQRIKRPGRFVVDRD